MGFEPLFYSTREPSLYTYLHWFVIVVFCLLVFFYVQRIKPTYSNHITRNLEFVLVIVFDGHASEVHVGTGDDEDEESSERYGEDPDTELDHAFELEL